MTRIHRFAAAVVLAGLIPGVVFACLWDYDTLKQERARFPDTLEIITGKFLRHSTEFYQWRIADRLERIKSEPTNPALHDDLAVAYLKFGQTDKAIETMRKVEAFAPNRYETRANLSVFYFYLGDLDQALDQVNQALKINPNAHFGREKYQKWLTEYVMQQSPKGMVKLPLGDQNRPGGFSRFLATRMGKDENYHLTREDHQEAVKGVLGMMRFADFESPILLEVLGDLLIGQHGHENSVDAKRLATRAYLKASRHAPDEKQRESYRKLAKGALNMQTRDEKSHDQLPLPELEADFQKELEEARRWYADLHAKELGWIRNGANPESEFDKLYRDEPRVGSEPTNVEKSPEASEKSDRTLFYGVIAAGVVLVALLAFWMFRRRAD